MAWLRLSAWAVPSLSKAHTRRSVGARGGEGDVNSWERRCVQLVKYKYSPIWLPPKPSSQPASLSQTPIPRQEEITDKSRKEKKKKAQDLIPHRRTQQKKKKHKLTMTEGQGDKKMTTGKPKPNRQITDTRYFSNSSPPAAPTASVTVAAANATASDSKIPC